MATTITKDGTGNPVAKPRKGASPSDNGTGTRRGLLSLEKPVPNYLRPTISSRGETPKELKKKPLSSPDNRKTVLTRRSSFDKAPVASHLQKIISSGPGERSVTVRSSSFSGRSGILHRPVSERTSTGPSRTVKAVSRTHLASNVGGKAIAKKSNPTASVSSSLAAKNKEKFSDAPVVVDDANGNDNSGGSSEASGEKLPSPMKEETEEVPKPAEAENIVVEHEDSDAVHEEHHDVAHLENDVVDKEEICAENGTVLASKEEDDKNSTAVAQPLMEEVCEEIEDKEEIVSDDSKGEEKEAEVPKGDAEAAEAEAEAETEDKKENKPMVEEVVVVAKEEKEAGDEAKKDEDSAVLISGSEKPSEEKEEEAANVEEEKQAAVVDAEKTVVKQRSEKPVAAAAAAAPVKKDPAQANNDIIEETTKKLMESSRKNKVKALAGAFETVISLEKPGQA